MQVEYLPDGSPDCPLIRLFDFDTVGACRLRSLFGALADGLAQEFVLTDLPDVVGVDDCRLALKVNSQDQGVVQVGGRVSFECLLSLRGWGTVADLAGPFCKEAAAGHFQWLDETSDISLLLSPCGEW